jgi:hypothetical protein
VISKIVVAKVQTREGKIPTMEPPKVRTHNQTTWKTCSIHKSLNETPEEEQAFTQIEGIVDVDAIPSPQIEPVTITLVEEEGKAPMMVSDGYWFT